MIVSVGRQADRELTEAALHYAREANVEIAADFIAEFERVLDLLAHRPQLGAVWHADRRRFPLRRFPYSVIYYVRDGELRVIALAHHRRKPGYWARRK